MPIDTDHIATTTFHTGAEDWKEWKTRDTKIETFWETSISECSRRVMDTGSQMLHEGTHGICQMKSMRYQVSNDITSPVIGAHRPHPR